MFEMKITGNTLEELAQNCFNLAGKLTSAPAPVAPIQPAPAAPVAPVPMAPVQSAPANPAPPVAAQPPVAAAPAYTHAQLMNAGMALVAANPAAMPVVQGLLQRYCVQAVTDLKPEQLGAFATELRGLGAQI